MTTPNVTSSDKTELFIELLTRYQQRVYLFIFSLVSNHADAEEVLQETNLTLWRKFEEFEPGTSFRAWAFQIAYYKARALRQRRQREQVHFGEEFFERVAAAAQEKPDDFDARQNALAHCMAKLSDKDRDLIRRRYRKGGSTKTVAEEVGRSIPAVYKAVGRIRRALFECIQRTVASEARA